MASSLSGAVVRGIDKLRAVGDGYQIGPTGSRVDPFLCPDLINFLPSSGLSGGIAMLVSQVVEVDVRGMWYHCCYRCIVNRMNRR